MTKQVKPDWIAVDWGTSNLRVWAMQKSGKVLAARASKMGMQGLTQADYEPALLDLINEWLTSDDTVQIICCGMVGSRQGWVEAGYRTAPCRVNDLGPLAIAPTLDPRIRVNVLPGIKQDDPADVMRGEETQIAGFLAKNPDFAGVVCLPGTHCKWVRIRNQAVLGFTTYMTGELFSLLSENSVLSHFVAREGWDQTAFIKALRMAAEFPAKTASQLFSLRAQSLIGDLAPQTARARLSGLLIGMEMGAAHEIWQGQKLAVLGATTLSKVYETALQNMGADPVRYDVENLTLAGCTAGYQQLECLV